MNMRTSTLSESPRLAPKLLELDAAAIAQTKVQIGTLVSEIAELAKTCETPAAFYPAMLARLVTAMAGTGAGVWQRRADRSWQLLHSINLPDSLVWSSNDDDSQVVATEPDASIDHLAKIVDQELDTRTRRDCHRIRMEVGHHDWTGFQSNSDSQAREPSPEHLMLLECVAREQQPILVPPGDIASSSERPTNPIQQCLIYSPVPVEVEQGQIWLQVIQPPSGGIATQRGYLRFVAQIADLTADFLKSFRLRQFENEKRLYTAAEQLLNNAAKPGNAHSKLINLVQHLRDLTGADQVILVQRTTHHQRWRIESVSGLRDLDQRSEGSQCIAELCDWISPQCQIDQPWMNYAKDRREHESSGDRSVSEASFPLDRFLKMFSAAAVAWLPLFGGTAENPSGVGCLVYWTWPARNAESASLEQLAGRAQALGRLGLTAIRPPSLQPAMARSNSKAGGLTNLAMHCFASRWARFAIATLGIIGIGMIPVPLRVVAPGTLQPSIQYRHYASSDARIVKVHVDYGQHVAAGQILLELEDRSLSNLYDDAVSQQLKSNERRRDIEARLLRGDRLQSDIRYELEGELETLRALAGSEQERIDALQRQIDLLTIRASEEGVIATWNARQLLQDRPVRVGQMLLLVQQPDGPWTIDARLPQKDVGKFLRTAQQGMPRAHFALASHPNYRIPAIYQPNETPAILSVPQDASQPSSLCVRFAVPVAALPQRNAGSSATITIDTGRGPLAWSVFGDAVLSLWAKVRLWI